MNRFNRQTGLELVVFVGLLVLAVASRFWLADIPNFKPVAALALLSGFLFSRIGLAVALPVLAMVISDQSIGTYEAPIMMAVYGSLALCPVIGWFAGRFVRSKNMGWLGQTGTLMASAFAMSLVFFVVTNLAVWTQWYERSWQGLGLCFMAALPFFKYTLVGNVVFSLAGFAGYRVVVGVAGKTLPNGVDSPELEAANLSSRS